MLYDKESALEDQPPIPVIVNGIRGVGRLVPDGNNVWVVSCFGCYPYTCELSVSWGLVLSVLNDASESPIELPYVDRSQMPFGV